MVWCGSPDLSVTARALSTNLGPSGTDYIYTYLRTFYRDTSRPTGWDNLVYPSVGMPHALWERQGPTSLERNSVAEVTAEDGSKSWVRTITTFDEHGFSSTQTENLSNYSGKAGETVKLTPVDAKLQAQFDSDIADLSNYMAWMAEPAQLVRKKIGVAVLLFLFVFFGVAWRLNKVYWKDIK